MNKERLVISVVAVVALVLVFVGTYSYLNNTNGSILNPSQKRMTFTHFTSAEDAIAYLQEASSTGSSYSSMRSVLASPNSDEFQIEDIGGTVGLGTADTKTQPPVSAGRVSETNVQVSGIDEPDIVKTDGKELYVSTESQYYYNDIVPLTESERAKETPPTSIAKTNLIGAFPPATMKKDGSVDTTGNLLISGNVMIVFSGTKIYGYDVANPALPVESWSNDIGSTSQLVAARLKDGKAYLIVRNVVQSDRPCPFVAITAGTRSVSIPCGDLYHPIAPTPVDGMYTAMVMDPNDGSVGKTVSFTGSTDNTTVYVSNGSFYVAYSITDDYVTYLYGFMKDSARDLFPARILDHVAAIMKLDISNVAKMTELEVTMQRFQSGLSSDAKLTFETEMNNRLRTYNAKHQRELVRTGIVRIGLDSMAVAALGDVPGVVLNQFALDEYNGMLRIATTSGESMFSGSSEGSVNDVYVLDGALKTVGSVLDLGKGERIYSARFVGNRGYVVTFRQIDPFYVLDLSDPRAPKKTGELKIPGYSSYLDPLTDTLVLGIGQDNFKVKLSLFDVSDATAPKELSTYLLDEYWTDVQQNHHAFLHDAKHKVFFIPSGKGSYVLSYDTGTLALKKAVSGFQARRAVYLDDYLYVVAADKITVLSETDWQQVGELAL